MNLVLTRRTLLAAATAAVATGARAQGSAFSMPIETDELSLILIARVGGEAAFVILDNGAAYTMADRSFGARAPSAMSPRVMARTLPVIELGPLVSLPARSTLDLAAFSAAHQKPISAIVGMDLFQAGVIDLDFVTRTLTLSAAPGEAPSGGRAVDLIPRPGLKHTVTMSIEGGAPFQALLDLGAGNALLVKPPLAERLGLIGERTPSTRLSTGVTGEGQRLDFIRRTGSAKSVAFAGAELTDVPFEVGEFATGGEALIGLPILRRFALRFDLGSDRLWASESARLREPFMREMVGLQAQLTNRGLYVFHIARGSPAAAAGFANGETIATINGGPPNPAILRTPKAGETLEFALLNGTVRTLTTARFD